jgi:hypothetical protein
VVARQDTESLAIRCSVHTGCPISAEERARVEKSLSSTTPYGWPQQNSYVSVDAIIGELTLQSACSVKDLIDFVCSVNGIRLLAYSNIHVRLCYVRYDVTLTIMGGTLAAYWVGVRGTRVQITAPK